MSFKVGSSSFYLIICRFKLAFRRGLSALNWVVAVVFFLASPLCAVGAGMGCTGVYYGRWGAPGTTTIVAPIKYLLIE